MVGAEPFKVVGIDPGIARCGVAELHDGRLVDVAVYGTDKVEGVPLRERLDEMRMDLAPHILGANVLVVESPSFPEGAVAAAMLWSAFGLILGLAHCRAHVHLFTPGGWRRELGMAIEKRGEGEDPGVARKRRKDATKNFVLRRYPAAERLLAAEGLASHQRDHAYDALALACAFLDQRAQLPAQTTFLECP